MNESPLRVLLVGGTGFLSGHVLHALKGAGHAITVISRGTRPVPDGVEHIQLDRRDTEALSSILEGKRFDFTVDFTAFSAVDVERLLLIPYAALGRYVLISTGQVYLVAVGSKPPFVEEDSDPPLMDEPERGTPDHAEWSYGVGKRLAENALVTLRETHGVRGTILRLPIIQGEGDGSLRLWAYLERMLDRKPIVLPDGGTLPVRHVYAGDVAAAVARLAARETPRDAAYNLAQADVATLRDMLDLVAHTAKVKPRFVEASWEEIGAAGLGRSISPYAGPWSSLLDPGRAAEWGFFGSRMPDFLPQVVKWHLKHRPKHSHPGYALRKKEIALAAKLAPARA